MDKIIMALIPLLIQVESGNNPAAFGDYCRKTGEYKAVGILQIHKCVIDDVNRIYKTDYTYNDRLNPSKSREIASKYLTFWGTHYEKKTGQKVTLEVLARCWNGGGPSGYKKDSTVKYYLKVKKEMERIQK